MNDMLAPNLSLSVLQALPQPVIVIDENRMVVFVNYAAESFFGASLSVLSRQRLDDLIAFGSPIVALAQSVAERRAPMTVSSMSLPARSPISMLVSPCCSRSAPWPTRSTGNW